MAEPQTMPEGSERLLSLLRVEGLSKAFPGVQALSDVTLDVNAGEILQRVLGSKLAGGHDQIAGGRIPVGPEPEVDAKAAALVRDRLLAELGAPPEATPLV